MFTRGAPVVLQHVLTVYTSVWQLGANDDDRVAGWRSGERQISPSKDFSPIAVKREREKAFFLPSPCEQTLSSFSKREDFLSLTLSEYTKGIEIVELEEEEEAFSQLHFAPCSRAYEQLTGLITRLKCPISCRK